MKFFKQATPTTKVPQATPFKFKPTSLMMAVEPRIMFDGAMPVTIANEFASKHIDSMPAVDIMKIAEVVQRDADAVQKTAANDSKPSSTIQNAISNPSQGANRSAHDIVFVDGRLPDYQQIVAAAESGIEVVVLDPNHDGVKQMADALKGRTDIASISIVSHGDSGVLLLGDAVLHQGDINRYSMELKTIGNALAATGDIKLYGCDVGAGSKGQAFIQALADVTGADIAASTNITGSVSYGGDWDLEISTGHIEATPVLDSQKISDWDHLAHTASVSNRTELISAIATAITDGSDDTITLTSDITLSSGQAITIAVSDSHTLTIVGGSHFISGNNVTRVFNTSTSNSGSAIALQNLTISNGFVTASGGTATAAGAGAGGDALGAAISNSGTLSITGVTFTGNKAAGGGGAGAGPGGQGGGGGGGGGFGTTNGGAGGVNDMYSAGPASAGTGGRGAGTTSTPTIGGGGGTSGGSSNGGVAGILSGGASGGIGGSANAGSGISIGGGGGGSGNYASGARGGNAVAAIYNNGGTVSIAGSTFTNNVAAGGGGGGGSVYAQFPGDGGNGGYGVATIWNKTGTVSADSATQTSIAGISNVGGGGAGGYANGGGAVSGTTRGSNQTLGTIGTLVSAPTVSNVSASTSNNSYKAGSTIDITVQFSAAVDVTGSPHLTLETGATDQDAVYLSGTGTDTLTFRYTVQAGDTTSDLDYHDTGALTLNGGTLYATGTSTAATRTLASPTMTGSLGANKAIVIDTTAPTLAITSDVSQLKTGETATITFTFSENPNSSFTWNGSAGDVVVSGGTLGAISGSGLTRTATFTPTASTNSGTASITVASAAYIDTAGNSGGAGTTPSLTFDTLVPSGSTPDLAAGSDSGTSSTDNITQSTTPTFTGTSEANATVILYDTDGTTQLGNTTADGSGDWSITSSTLSEGDHTLYTKVTDLAGNVSSLSTGLSTTVDTTAPTTTIATLALSADTGTSSTDFITKTAAQTISGTTSANLVSGEIVEVSTDNGNTWNTATTSVGANTWSISSTFTASDTLKVRVSDTAGNTGTASSQAYVLDTTAPTTTIATASFSADTGSSSTDFITKTAAQTVSGTLSANLVSGESLEVSIDNGSTWSTATTTVGANTWSLSSTLTASNTLKVRVTDTAGNTGTVFSQAYVLDTTAPTLAITSNVSTLKIGETATITFTFSEDPGSSFTWNGSAGDVVVSGGSLGAISGSGLTRTATFTPTASTNSGTASITVASSAYTDTAGNNGGAGTTPSLTFDTLAPSGSTPDLAAGSDSGTSNTDDITQSITPTFTGTAEANATVTLYDIDGTTQLGNTTADGSGAWSITSSTLSESAHTLYTKVTDLAGNVSSLSTGLSITVDATAPTTTIATLVLSADTGTSSTDFITKTAAQTISGTTSANLVSGEIVEVSIDNGSTWSTATTTVGANTWSLSSTLSASNTLKVRVTDTAGNTGTVFSQAYVLDTTAPSAPSAPDMSSGTDNGVSNTDNITHSTTPTFTGTSEADASITLYDTDGTTVLGTSTADGSGNWSITNSTLTAGAHTLTAKATDTAGNRSSASSGLSVTIDTTAPTLAITSNVSTLKVGETATITFTFSEDPGSTFTWNGSSGDVVVSGGTLSALSGSGLTRTATFTPTASTNTSTASITVAAGGSYTDTAGNNGGAGTTPSLTFDTLAPNAPSTPDMTVGTDLGTSSSDNQTSDSTPTFTGTAEANAIVTVYDTDGTTSLGTTTADGSGNWSITASTLSEGSHTITAKATDTAGNASNASSGLSATIDITAPTVVIVVADTALSAGETSLVTITFSEAVTDFSNTDLSIVNGTLTTVSSGDGGITWTSTFTPTSQLNDATNVITLDKTGVNDIAGNAGIGSTNSNNYAIDTRFPTITSATYNVTTGVLDVTGSDMTTGDTINPSKLTLKGEGNTTYTLTSSNVTASSNTAFSISLNTTDQAALNMMLNKAGTSSTGNTTYNLASADDWDSNFTATNTADATNALTVSNVPVPTITSATYNETTGALVVTGTGFVSASGVTNDIIANKFTLTGEDGSSYTLTNATSNVEITSATSFTITIYYPDRGVVNQIINKAGTTSTTGATYNLAAAEDWAAGADATVSIADLSNNTISASNVPAPTLGSAVYDVSTGIMTFGGNFVSRSGSANDIDVSKLSISGEGVSYTLTSSNVDLTSASEFSVTLNSTDRAAINQFLNKNGSNSTSGPQFNIAAAEDWASGADAVVAVADLINNTVSVINVAIPTITSATYDTLTGNLVVTGTGFLKLDGAANEIIANKFTLTGGNSSTYTLTDSSNVDISSGTSFTLALSATDKAAINLILDKNGSSSTHSTTYNLAAAEDWATGATSTVNVVDLTGNGITTSGINAAPTLSGGPYTFTSTNEDTASGAVTVSTILGGTNYADSDSGALSGIAVTTKAGNGTWEYSTDGTTWMSFNSVSTSAALLLNSSTQVRYTPDALNGETATLTFRAWDQTSGTASTNSTRQTADTTSNGDISAFSTGTATGSLTVTDVNDASTLSTNAAAPSYTENENAVYFFSHTIIDTIEASQNIDQITLTVSNLSNGSNEILGIDGSELALTDTNSITTATNGMTATVSLSGGTATVTISKNSGISLESAQTLVNGLTYRNSSDNPDTSNRVVTLTSIRDNGGSQTTTLSTAATVTVIAANDRPVLSDTTLTLTSIDEGSGSPSGAIGTLVTALISNTNVSDADGNDLGLAITGVNASGTLWYSTDNGSNWTQLGSSLSESNALLLHADSTTRIYFKPNSSTYSGTLSDAITFRAWDRTGGLTNASLGSLVAQSSSFVTDGDAYSVAISGHYAYVAVRGAGLQVVDISNPASPTTVTTLDTTGITNNVVIRGNYAYIVDGTTGSGTAGLKVIDISNPLNPTQVAHVTGPIGAPYRVVLAGDYAYLAEDVGGVEIINISNPTNPTLVGRYDSPGITYGADVVGHYLYVADRASGLQIVDVSDPANPVAVGNYDTDGLATRVKVVGNYAYVADDTGGLLIINVSNPATPTLAGSYDTSGSANDVTIQGNYAYVSDMASGVQIIDIYNPASPTLVNTVDTSGSARSLVLHNDRLYIADTSSGMQIIPISTVADYVSQSSDTVSLTVNPTPPTLSSASYDAGTGILSVTGSHMTTGDTIAVNKLTLTGEGGSTYTLTTSSVTATSSTAFSITLNATDKGALNQILNKNGSSSTGGTSFNIAATDDWDSNVTTSDTTDATNAVTVSNVAAPTITSVAYNADIGALVVTGTGFLSASGATNDIVANTFTFTGEGSESYTLTNSSNVEISSGTSFTISLSVTDRAAINMMMNKNGTSSTSGTSYNLAAAEDWAAGADAAVTVADLTGNSITVSNVAIPVISYVDYNATTGILTVHGGGFVSLTGAANDISVNKLSLVGEGGSSYTLTDSSDVEITSGSLFTVNLSATDKAAINLIMNRNGSVSTNSTNYNLVAAEDWAAGADTTVAVVDATSHIDVAGVGIPTISSATYDMSTGIMTVDGTGFLSAHGSANDIVANKLTFAGEGGSTYTLTDSANVDITSGTAFSITLSATDQAALKALFNKNGTTSTGGTIYNIAASEDWAAGADATVAVVDATGNGITASSVATPAIASATYDANTGALAVTGTGFLRLNGATNDIVANKFTFAGEGGSTYTLTDSANVEITSGTAFTLSLSATDKAGINLLINKNGTSSTGATTYNLAAAEDWAAGADAAVAVVDATGNGITASNVAIPAITSATYDASSGALVVTGTDFLSLNGVTNDIVANKFTFTGEGGSTYTLTDSANVEITSGTAFTLSLSATDKAGINLIINKNGASSTGATTYNLAAAEDWAAGADAAVAVVDATGNGITASNVATPTITNASYDASSGALAVTGTGFLSLSGATNDIVANKFTFTGEGGSTYTLTDSANVEITSGTAFTLNLSVTDKVGINLLLNKNGTSSTGATTYNLAAAEDWAAGADATVAVVDATSNDITASNVAIPAITNATYDASSGALAVTGTGFLSLSGATNDIVANKFTFTGEGGSTYTLTNSANVEITSGTAFTLNLSATDKAGINLIINKNGMSSTSTTTYNLAAAEDWAAGADATVAVVDTTGNGITASNVTTPAITSATYDASSGALAVTGTGFLSLSGTTNDIVANKFTFTGEGGSTYMLTDSANVEITSGTAFTLSLSATDKAGINSIINKNGTSSTSTTTYNLAAAEDWAAGADATVTLADLTDNGIAASNVGAPVITSATYNASTGALVVTGTGFLSASGAANDIAANKFTLTGEGGSTYTLTDTANVEVTSETAFTLMLSATDKAAINLSIINKNGTSSTSTITYNLAAAEDWAVGADAAVTVMDTTNAITVSHVAVPTISNATYDAGTGSLVVTGANFLTRSGATNDIDVSKLTLIGKGNETYTLTSSNVDIINGTNFTVILNETDKAALNQILNKEGAVSSSATLYNLSAAEDWAIGADAALSIADLADNGVVVSHTAPTLSGMQANQLVTDNTSLTPFASIVIADTDTTQIQTVTVTLDTAAKGNLSNLSGGSYNASTGVYSFSGIASQAQTALGALVFTPTANHVNPGFIETTTLSVRISDGIASAVVDNTTTVMTTSVNTAPVITSNEGGNTVNLFIAENTTAVTTVGANDSDLGDSKTFSIAGGADKSLFAINASTGALYFVHAPNFEMPQDISVDNTYEVIVRVEDGQGGSDTQTLNVAVTDQVETISTITPTLRLAPGSDTGISNSDDLINTSSIGVVGTAEAGSMVTLKSHGNVIGTVTAASNGQWQLSGIDLNALTDDANDEVPGGVYTLIAQSTTVQGGISAISAEVSLAVTLDLTPPPSLLSLVLEENSDSAPIGDHSTTELNVNFSVQLPAGASIGDQVVLNADLDGDEVYETVAATPIVLTSNHLLAGSVSISVDAHSYPDQRAVSFHASLVDRAGNVSVSSPGHDTTAVSFITDFDGITPTTEDGAGGDFNQDGLDDSQQSDVATAPLTSARDFSQASGGNTSGVTYGAIVAGDSMGSGTPDHAGNIQLRNITVTPVIESSGNATAPLQSLTSQGLGAATDIIGFTAVANANRGQQPDSQGFVDIDPNREGTQVRFTMDLGGQGITATRVMKVRPDGSSFNYTATSGNVDGGQLIDLNNDGRIDRIILTITDNGIGDFNAALGVIDDPIFLAVPNAAPQITSNGGQAAAHLDMAETSQIVTTITTLDDDHDAISYNITGGVDQDKFVINNTTGQLSFISTQNVERPTDSNTDNRYVVDITASDGKGGVVTQSLTITVKPSVNQTIIPSVSVSSMRVEAPSTLPNALNQSFTPEQFVSIVVADLQHALSEATTSLMNITQAGEIQSVTLRSHERQVPNQFVSDAVATLRQASTELAQREMLMGNSFALEAEFLNNDFSPFSAHLIPDEDVTQLDASSESVLEISEKAQMPTEGVRPLTALLPLLPITDREAGGLNALLNSDNVYELAFPINSLREADKAAAAFSEQLKQKHKERRRIYS